MFLQWCVLSQGLNQGVTVEGKKKVDVLRATKDFKKGIYGLQWEHTRGNMEVLAGAALYHTFSSAIFSIYHLLDDNFTCFRHFHSWESQSVCAVGVHVTHVLLS